MLNIEPMPVFTPPTDTWNTHGKARETVSEDTKDKPCQPFSPWSVNLGLKDALRIVLPSGMRKF